MTPAERAVVKAALQWRLQHDGPINSYLNGSMKDIFAFRDEDARLIHAVDNLVETGSLKKSPKKTKKRK